VLLTKNNLYVSYEIGLAAAPPEPEPDAVPPSFRGFADFKVLFLKRNQVICINLHSEY
jgi:hypothetical protein